MKTDRTRAAELLVAAQIGDVARVGALLPSCGNSAEDGAATAAGGVTPLMAAADGGHGPMVALLLRCGADPARRDAGGHSAAFHARAAGHPHLAAQLDSVVDQEKTIR